MIKISNFFLISFIFMVVFLSQIGMHSGVTPIFAGIGVIVFVTTNIAILIINHKIIKIPYIPRIFYVLFYGLIIFSIISYFNTGRPKGIIVYGALISLFFTARILSLYIKDKEQFLLDLVFGSCLTGIVIILLGIDGSFSFYRYKGFYTNANSLGMFAASLLHMLIGVLYAYGKIKYGRIKKFVFYTTFFLCLMLLLASNSRAAILSVLLIVLLIPIIELYKALQIRKFKIKTIFFKRFIFFFLIISLSSAAIYYLGLFDNIFEKFDSKTNRGDVSDGRLESWKIMIKNWSWFGHENSWFKLQKLITIPKKTILFGHNTWLSHLNYYGLLNFLFFISWIIFMILWAWNNIKIDTGDRTIIVFFFVMIGYVINATFETATSTPGLFISISIFGIIYSNKTFSKKKKEQ